MKSFTEYLQHEKEDLQFCAEREKGAAKIAREAAAKGGYSRLTAWHFEAKHPEYQACKKAIAENKPKHYYKDQMIKFMNEAKNASNQKTYQMAIGRAEVWGEIYHQL